MQISEEAIIELRKRVDISYEEAEKWLKRTKGNVDEAERKIHYTNNSYRNQAKCKFSNVFNYKFLLKNENKTIIDLPFWILLLVYLLLMMGGYKTGFLTMFFVILILFTKHEIIITDRSEQCEDTIEHNSKSCRTQYDAAEGYYEKEIIHQQQDGCKSDVVDDKVNADINNDKKEQYYEITIED